MSELRKLELKYIEMFETPIGIFPKYWNDVDDEKLKIQVLKDAIKEKTYIVNVKNGSKFVEGIY